MGRLGPEERVEEGACAICGADFPSEETAPAPRLVPVCAGCSPGLFAGGLPPLGKKRAFERVELHRLDEVQLTCGFRSVLKHCERAVESSASLIDLSEAGAHFAGHLPSEAWLLPLRRRLILFDLRLVFPGGTSVEILASLRWHKRLTGLTGESDPGYRFGVQHEQLNPSHKPLQTYLRERKRRSEGVPEGDGESEDQDGARKSPEILRDQGPAQE